MLIETLLSDERLEKCSELRISWMVSAVRVTSWIHDASPLSAYRTHRAVDGRGKMGAAGRVGR